MTKKYAAKDFALDVVLYLSGMLVGIALSVGQTGAPVKVGPVTIVNKAKELKQNA